VRQDVQAADEQFARTATSALETAGLGDLRILPTVALPMQSKSREGRKRPMLQLTLPSLLALGVLATSFATNAYAAASAQADNQARPSGPQPDFVLPAPPAIMPPAPSAQLAEPIALPREPTQ
jgi:hypothetical protein